MKNLFQSRFYYQFDRLLRYLIAYGRGLDSPATFGINITSVQVAKFSVPLQSLAPPFPMALTTHALYVCSPEWFGITT
ncbi:hypothetical protein GCM10022405_24030 [Gibbsiella dentisursi]|uniref:Uncharacterized protein n=1 Tax=Gibbsiella dentisursi TaxID=796890 RepID=A0ABP7LAB5_9GAMM